MKASQTYKNTNFHVYNIRITHILMESVTLIGFIKCLLLVPANKYKYSECNDVTVRHITVIERLTPSAY